VDNKPIYYWVDQKDKAIPEDAGFVGVVNSTNITVSDLNLINNYAGLLFVYTENSMIDNVSTSNNYYCGIHLSYSSNNTLANNTANLNIEDSICLWDSSNNTLTNNIATDARYGISLYHSSNNTLTSNICSSNSCGIILCHSSNNTLSNNTANSNDNYLMDRCFGILLDSSNNNSIMNNTADSNKYCGIGLYSSSDNKIICNLVQNNTCGGFYLSNSFSSGNNNNIISHNNIIKNGNYNAISGGWEWQFWNHQSNSVEAKHNYWGDEMNNSMIIASIYSSYGNVEYYPFELDPVPCAFGSKHIAFTYADVLIALQITVGSRKYDSYLDVNGDRCITFRDVLMILLLVVNNTKL
jgi:parallel beta-helix repeat protein